MSTKADDKVVFLVQHISVHEQATVDYADGWIELGLVDRDGATSVFINEKQASEIALALKGAAHRCKNERQKQEGT